MSTPFWAAMATTCSMAVRARIPCLGVPATIIFASPFLVGEVSGLAETVDGGADIDALDFQSENAGGAANITSLVLTSVETLMLGGTELKLRAGQLGSFTTIHGTGFVERVILASSGTADLSGASIVSIEEFRGSGGADKLVFDGVAGGFFVDGLAGADSLSGNDGNDTISGEQGADNIDAGPGNDVIQIAGISDVSGLAETIDGGNDADTLDFLTLGATGRADLSLVTILNVENLQTYVPHPGR